MIAGGFAGALAKTSVAPLERVKILWPTRTGGFHNLGVYQSMNKLLKHEGNGASVIRIVPYAALHFTTYERYKSWILNHYPVLGTGPSIDLSVGSAAGGTSVMCIPFRFFPYPNLFISWWTQKYASKKVLKEFILNL